MRPRCCAAAMPMSFRIWRLCAAKSRQKAQEEARALIKRAQDKVDNTLAEMRHAQTEGRQTERVRQKIKDIGSDLQAAIQDKLSADQPAALELHS